MSQATSWNSELPSGRNPFWIKDEALAQLGLHAGDAVGVDTRSEPTNGDLVLVEVETDELAERLVRRYFAEPEAIRLAAENPAYTDLVLMPDQLLVLGVVRTKLQLEQQAGAVRVVEQPIG